ncbi:N-acetylmuramoyl-L-alanine amidase [Clostridium sp.]|uniref:N-acetylmuramoyl-L-alanine amidase n=1 Tax=Clostridium sp. TaxID=1506 RepID=UPI001A4138F2|nr:N-acetylmuramoyl-L-alanine amidase [Clostridium sp.]MBK5239847.1 N-acetylmuramoyl-L-alanine amidase [Clostridium sp.]
MSNKIYTHCLDPGHGGTDCGAVGKRSHEDDVALVITKIVGRILVEQGQKVVYTRTTSEYKTLAKRADIANKALCKTFTSIHCNSAVNKTAHGVETFSHPISSNGAKLSKFVQAELVKATGLANRGSKTANFGVLRMSHMVAILVETAFISNANEENLLLSKVFQEKAALSIVKGLFKYLGLTLNQSTQVVTPTTPVPTLPHMYRVRVSWEDVKSQKAAYSNLQNATDFLKTLNQYKIFDENGNEVGKVEVTPVVSPTPKVSTGNVRVKALQQLCNSLGIHDMNGRDLVCDNISGSKTEFAVARLPLCGLPYTQRAATKVLQSILNQLGYRDNNGKVLAVDGIFYTSCAESVAKYQKAKNLNVDKIVGKNVWLSFLK